MLWNNCQFPRAIYESLERIERQYDGFGLATAFSVTMDPAEHSLSNEEIWQLDSRASTLLDWMNTCIERLGEFCAVFVAELPVCSTDLSL